MHIILEKFAEKVNELVGTSMAFVLALLIALAWFSMIGRDEIFGIERISVAEFATIFMFLQLFLLQRTQNKNNKALHLKLDELIASKDGADNHLIKAERTSEEHIDELRSKYVDLADSEKNCKAAVSLNNVTEAKKTA